MSTSVTRWGPVSAARRELDDLNGPQSVATVGRRHALPTVARVTVGAVRRHGRRHENAHETRNP